MQKCRGQVSLPSPESGFSLGAAASPHSQATGPTSRCCALRPAASRAAVEPSARPWCRLRPCEQPSPGPPRRLVLPRPLASLPSASVQPCHIWGPGAAEGRALLLAGGAALPPVLWEPPQEGLGEPRGDRLPVQGGGPWAWVPAPGGWWAPDGAATSDQVAEVRQALRRPCPSPGSGPPPPSPQLGPGLPPRRGCADGGRPSCSSRPLCTTGAAARYQPARPARAPAACRPSAGAALPPCLRLLPSPYPPGPMSQRQAQEQPAPPRGGRGHGEQRGWAPARPAAPLRRDRGCRRSRGRASGKAGRNIQSEQCDNGPRSPY